MHQITDQTFRNIVLQIDNTAFVDCLLIDCILEYQGGPISFERTEMRTCRYVFFGRARRTVHFLQGVGLLPCVAGEWAEVSETVH